MVELSQISKSYHGQNQVLDRVDLKLKKGDFLYVVGGSGAGKSSLLRMLATEESPTGGSISLFGYDLSRVSSPTLQSIRKAVGYVPQGVKLIPDLSVSDNILLPLAISKNRAAIRESRGYMMELLDKLGLSAKRDTLASQLSGGEAQRVAVARALIRNPDLLITDEPTGAQDKDYTWSVMDLFLKANLKGVTVVVATHDREIVRRVRKRCAVLKNGRIVVEESLCSY